MSYTEIATWVAVGLSASAVGFVLMIAHSLLAVAAVGLGLYVASLGVFVGIEEAIRRSRDEVGEEDFWEPSAEEG